MHCAKYKKQQQQPCWSFHHLELLHLPGGLVVVIGAEGGDGGHVVVVVGLGTVVVNGFSSGVFGDVFCVC